MTKSEYKVVYRHQVCSFHPTNDMPFEQISDFVEGKVLFIENGEYNPISWYKPVVVKKSDLMFVCDERYTNCDNCDVQIDCEEQHIFCIYRDDEEMTICEACNHDLKAEFQEDGYECDDWELLVLRKCHLLTFPKKTKKLDIQRTKLTCFFLWFMERKKQ